MRRTPAVETQQQPDGIEPESPPTPSRAGGITWRLVVLVVVVLGVAIVLAQSLRIYFMQAAEIAEVRERIAVTQEKIAEQRDQLERWNDPEYVKSQARVRLGWVMPGEVGYRVIDADGNPVDGSETIGGGTDELTGPWYERMWTTVQLADQPEADPDEDDGESEADDTIIGLETPSPSASPSPEPSPSPSN